MRRPRPSPFGRARHAHRYHRRTKRKYRAVAINGFTPEHLHVGRPADDAGRGRETGRPRGEAEERREKVPLFFLLATIGKTRRSTMYRPTYLPSRIIEARIFRYAPVPSSARAPVARPGSIPTMRPAGFRSSIRIPV